MAKQKEEYRQWVKEGDSFTPVPDVRLFDRLPPGMYEAKYNGMTGQYFFKEVTPQFDKLVDLPSPYFKHVVNELELFMEPSTKEAFEMEGYTYKRSTLLYGPAGTGKTSIVNRIVQKVIQLGGTVLFNPDPKYLTEVFQMLESIQSDTQTLVVFEEFDQMLKHNEGALLSLLDGQTQKNNIIIMATTNFIEKIPARILRPGRFSSVIEVGYPGAEEREFFLKTKMQLNRDKIPQIVEMTNGFSVDELKEVVIAHNCLQQPLDKIVDRIKATEGRQRSSDTAVEINVTTHIGKLSLSPPQETVDHPEDELDYYACKNCGKDIDFCLCDSYNGN